MPLRRRLSIIALFAGWLCASGAMLDIAQVFAWTRMFSSYAAVLPVTEAAEDTFDGSRPCEICRAVQHAREQEANNQQTSAPDTVKVVMALHVTEAAVCAATPEPWPSVTAVSAEVRRDPVPVPPPRGRDGAIVA